MNVNNSDYNSSLGDYFEQVTQHFKDLDRQGTQYPQLIDLCQKTVCLQFNSAEMAELLLPPLSHLVISEQETTSYNVYNIDQGSMPIPPPSFIANIATSERGIDLMQALNSETIFYQNEIYSIAYKPNRKQFSAIKKNTSQAIYWVASIENLYPLDGRPLRNIFQWLLEDSNYQIVHAAGVGFKDQGVIITGGSGAGKSTAAVACFCSELGFAGDENVVLSSSSPYSVYSLYNSTNLDRNSIGLLAFMGEDIFQPKENLSNKNLYYMADRFESNIINNFPLKAILVSSVSGIGRSKIETIPKMKALTALAPTSIFQIPGNQNEAFERMGKVVKNTPCYQLTLGKSLEDVPELISHFLQNGEYNE